MQTVWLRVFGWIKSFRVLIGAALVALLIAASWLWAPDWVRYFWAPFVASLVILVFVARNFTRTTLRWTAAIMLVGASAALLTLGAWGQTTLSPLTAFDTEFDIAARYFWAPFYGGKLYEPPNPPGAGVWIVAAVALVVIYYLLELVSARRESPRVDVATPDGQDGATGEILNELSFRLPAVELRKPANVPGAGAEVSSDVASVVEATGSPSGRVAAAVVRIATTVLPQPPAYLVKVCAESRGQDRRGPTVRLDVDVREQRTGRSLAVKIFDQVPRELAAAWAAGFAATQLFHQDGAAPPWVPGTFDGQDLVCYLVDLQSERENHSHDRVRQERLRRIRGMEQIIHDGPASGIVRYDLASLYELENRFIESLRLYALNRLQYPEFDQNTYRFACSLSMVAGAIEDVWVDRPGASADDVRRAAVARGDVYRYLDEAGLNNRNERRRVNDVVRAESSPEQIRGYFAALAVREFRRYRRRLLWIRVLWTCVTRREQRSSTLPYLSRAKRRVARKEARTVLHLAKARRALADAENAADGQVDQIKDKIRNESPRREAAGTDLSWVTTYNRACFVALQAKLSDNEDAATKRQTAIDLVQRSIDARDNGLRRPSEWIGIDPDLSPLRAYDGQDGAFEELVQRQIRRDFVAPEGNEPTVPLDGWFEGQLTRAFPPGRGLRAAVRRVLRNA